MTKEEAKEEGAATKHIQVVYSAKRKKIFRLISYALIALILLIICVGAFSYAAIKPDPRFRLDNLYVSPLSSTSSVMVQLSSTNPSSKISIYYTNMNLHMSVLGNFETESVSLENKHQEAHGVATWTAVVANNSDQARPSGAFLVRNGLADGDVIADLLIQWKFGFFKSLKRGYQVRCPVLLRLEDLSSAIAKPMSTCSCRST